MHGSDDTPVTATGTHTKVSVLKHKLAELTMQPVIALIGDRRRAEKFLRAITRWSNQVEIVMPQIRAISSYEQTRGHYIVGYVLLGGMPDEELADIVQAVRERGMGEPVKKYDTPDKFRRAVYALRIVPSQVGDSIRVMPIPRPVSLSPTGA